MALKKYFSSGKLVYLRLVFSSYANQLVDLLCKSIHRLLHDGSIGLKKGEIDCSLVHIGETGCYVADNCWISALQCVRIVRIRSFSGPYFPAFRLNIQSKYERKQTRKTPNMDTSSDIPRDFFLFEELLHFTIAKLLVKSN